MRLIILILVPLLIAWNWEGHIKSVEYGYYSLDDYGKETLNLTALKEGSTAPDKHFRDYIRHSYPRSLKEADYWLNKSKYYYQNKQYNEASYAFGVASHYITDSFSDPHYISKEKDSDHANFEDIDNYMLDIKCEKITLNLNETLYEASRNVRWEEWLNTKNNKIPEERFSQASQVVLYKMLETFELNCGNNNTIFKKNYDTTLLISLSIIITLLISLIFIYRR